MAYGITLHAGGYKESLVGVCQRNNSTGAFSCMVTLSRVVFGQSETVMVSPVVATSIACTDRTDSPCYQWERSED